MKRIELSPRSVLGPYIRKKLGKPATVKPRQARAPSAHASSSVREPRPAVFMGAGKELVSKPVAKTTTSAAWVSPSEVAPG